MSGGNLTHTNTVNSKFNMNQTYNSHGVPDVHGAQANLMQMGLDQTPTNQLGFAMDQMSRAHEVDGHLKNSSNFMQIQNQQRALENKIKNLNISGMDKISVGKDSTSQYQVPINLSMNLGMKTAPFDPKHPMGSMGASKYKMQANEMAFSQNNE